MASVHADEVAIDEVVVRRLVDQQFPGWKHLRLAPAGHGTDNRMLRLGDWLVVRLPRTPGTAADVAKEQTWLPRLAPHLPLAIPEPVAVGRPGDGYPFSWSIYRWIDGHALDPDTLDYRAGLGRDLARFVRALHSIDFMGARREKSLLSYRGGTFRQLAHSTSQNLAACRSLAGLDLDLAGLESIWTAASELPEPTRPAHLEHTDLKPSNLLVRDGALVGVIDFGGLSVGDPTCEHAATWDLPPEARRAYADELGLDPSTQLRAKAWAMAIALSGVPYYWPTWPDFARECLRRLDLILTDTNAV